MSYLGSIELTGYSTKRYELIEFRMNGKRIEEDLFAYREKLLAGPIPEGVRAVYQEFENLSTLVLNPENLKNGIPLSATLAVQPSLFIFASETPKRNGQVRSPE